MPDLSSYASILRAGGYWSELYLSTFDEEVVLTGEVTADAADAATTISYTNVSGSHTNVLPNMEVLVKSAGGALKGRLRVAVGGASSSLLQVNEFSPGRVKVVTGDTVEVLKSFRLRDLLVSNSLEFLKDGRITYSDQNSLIAPIANHGGLWVGFTDPLYEDPVAPVGHYGSLSYNLDPDSSTDGTHQHDLAPDATFDDGYEDVDADVVALYPPGTHVGRYTYTDADNSKSSSKATLVRVHDDDDPPIPLRSARLNGNRRDGYTATFSAYAGCGIEALPDGALVVLWKREWRNHGVAASYGSKVAGRSHIKFVGFLLRDTVEIDPRTGTVTFEAVSPLEILRKMTGFTQALRHVASATNWQEFVGLSVKQMIVYLLRWHTTAFELLDFIWNVDGFYTYPELFMQKSTPGDQVREMCDAISARFSCDRTGRFEVNRSLQRADSGERATAVTAYTIEAQDRTGRLTIPTEHRYEVAQVEGLGFTAAYSPEPLRCVAPGEAPAEAPDYRTVERQIVNVGDDNTADLRLRTGHTWAEMNSLYDGQPVPKGVQVQLPPGYDMFDIGHEEWVKLLVATSTNPRGRGFTTSNRFIIDAIEVEYQTNGLETTMLTLDHETRGEPAVKRDIVVEVVPETPGEIPQYTPPDVDLGANAPDVAFVDRNNQLILTSRFNTTSPNHSGLALALAGTANDWIAIPANPANAVIATTTGIYTLENVGSSGRTLTLRHTFAVAGLDTCIRLESERANPDLIVCIRTAVNNKTLVNISTDGGVNWSSDLELYNSDNNAFGAPGLYVSGHIGGRIYASPADSGGTATTGQVSSDSGSSFGNATNPNFNSQGSAYALHIPYFENPADAITVFGRYTVGDLQLYRSNGTGQTDISPNDGGTFGAQFGRAIDTSPTGRRGAFAARRGNTGGSDLTRVYWTHDYRAASVAWIPIADTEGTAGSGYYTWVRYSGDNPDVFWTGGDGGRIGVVINGVFRPRMGNIAALSPGRLLNMIGI